MNLKIHKVSLSIKGRLIVNDVSITVNPGEVVGLMGPNGAGKTTTFNLAVGNIKPDKYIFKKKLNLRRKSKRRLFTESFFLFILSVLLVYINYLIPNKNLLLQNLPSTFNKSFLILIELFSYLYEIFLVFFIFVSSFTALILMIGSFNRLFKVSKRKSKKIVYK